MGNGEWLVANAGFASGIGTPAVYERREASDFEFTNSKAYAAARYMNFPKFQRVTDRLRWRQWAKVNLRAAGALLIFLFAWSALPVAMLAQESDVCSMECCVAEGHCCCATHKPFVEGHDYSGVREIGSAENDSPCQRSATPPSGVKILSRQLAPATAHLPAPEKSAQSILRRDEDFYRSLRFSPDSSRAPPAFLLNS